jgi:hypothetical protein
MECSSQSHLMGLKQKGLPRLVGSDEQGPYDWLL